MSYMTRLRKAILVEFPGSGSDYFGPFSASSQLSVMFLRGSRLSAGVTSEIPSLHEKNS